ncbi:uncharacterized protein JCM6883_007624 [Sporobolomyces salmoneus]|uniref:uncharacterized protein n=1 Tax=Sporobolomyces salmoneus TaxID=183962 RepID=UPI0031730225
MFPSNFLSPIPRQGLPSHSFTYLSPFQAPSPLSISIPIPPLRNKDKHASFVWNASIVLADMIANEKIKVERKTVLEPGCGVGLPSIVAAHKGAQQVVLSDYDDPRMLDDLKEVVHKALISTHRNELSVVGHSFGEPISSLLGQVSPCPYDIILVADCIWDRALHVPLLDTLTTLLEASSPSTAVHFERGGEE